jgi:hypothetical protein
MANNVINGGLGYKGERGDDGVSPVIEVSKTSGVATITITDVEGTKTVELSDGELTKAMVVDNLTTTTTDVPLSAKQGKVLNDKIPDVYSTSEVKTNKVWTDGKPIYRKVIDTGDLATGFDANDNNKYINLNVSNVDKIIDTECRAYYSSGASFDYDNYVYYSSVLSSWIKLNVNVSPVAIELYYLNANRLSSISSSFIVVEYTKSTD